LPAKNWRQSNSTETAAPFIMGIRFAKLDDQQSLTLQALTAGETNA